MKNSLFSSFWQNMHRVAGEKGLPLRVMFELTYQCNFRCRHCYIPRSFSRRYKGKELKTKEVFSILTQLRDSGCFYLGFTGGEPFVRQDFLEIVGFAKKCGFEVIIYTNGSLIDEKKADQLAGLNLNKIDITLPALNKIAFNHITGVNSLREVLKAVTLLSQRNAPLGFKTCVLKENESQINKIKSFAHSFGGLLRLDEMLSPRWGGSKEPFKYRSRASFKMLRRVKPEKEPEKDCVAVGKRLKPGPGDLFTCQAGITQAAITPAGELKLCLMIDHPNFKISSANFDSCWERLKKMKAAIQPDADYQCLQCRFQEFCQWCPGWAWAHNKTFTACNPENRLWAQALSLCP